MNDDDILMKYVMNRRQLEAHEPVPVTKIDGILFTAAKLNNEWYVYLLAPSGEYKGKYLNIDSRFAQPFITPEMKNTIDGMMIFFDDETAQFF